MNGSNQKTLRNITRWHVVLAVLLLILGAVMLRHLDFPAYSEEEIRHELSALCVEYAELRERGAEEAEWQSFEQRARKITQPIVADLENWKNPSRFTHLVRFHQLARYDLPRAITSRGSIGPSGFQEQFQAIDALNESVAEMETASKGGHDAQGRAGRYGDAPEGTGGVDLVFVGAVICNGALLIAIGYLLFWPVRKHLLLSKDAQSMLRRLDTRIERNPDSACDLAIRARLLADAGRPGDAIADIDRILALKAHGVDLEHWQQMREELLHKVSAAHIEAAHGPERGFSRSPRPGDA